MASNSNRRSGSSERSGSRKRVVIGADETTRVRYNKDRPQVESERRKTPRQTHRATAKGAGSGGPRPSSAGKRLAQEKRDERERRQRSIFRRRAGLVVLVAAVVVGVVWGASALWNARIFTVDSIQVSGNDRLSTADVTKLAAVPAGATLLKTNTADVKRRIEANPWVADAAVSRSFPHELVVAITERTPAAFVDAGGSQLWTLSTDGFWLGKRSANDTSALVTIKDVPSLVPTIGVAAPNVELKNALAVLAGLSPGLKGQVKTLSAPNIDKTALLLNNGVQVFVGSSDNIAKKDLIARGILAREKNIVYINVRVVDRPTWRGLDQGN